MQIAAFACIGIIGITVLVFGIIFVANIESDIPKVEDTFAEVEDVFNKEIRPVEVPEVQEKLDAIKKIADESEFSPLEREWITSGPFQVDRSEYAIGESIFIRMGGIDVYEKGQIAIYRPLNATHHKIYLTIPFDGTDKSESNTYFTPQINKFRGICSMDDLQGEWMMVFRGTNYPNLYFEINEKILPGTDVSSVC
jgi:hypothetical protein